jgi:hypothetical protein
MAQHDYNVANATGAAFRADLNNALSAAVTQNSGSAEPSPAFAGMLWLDLSGGGDGIMRRRNQANTAWLTDIGVDNTARTAAAAAQAKADRALLRDASATAAERTMALSLLLPATAPTGNEAVSRANADALYQVKLPIAQAGSLLVGQAGGWLTATAPGATDTVLAISGGLPAWQATAIASAPNSLVRTKSDGTIDPSFIPGVASGLKFCGTFKPVVNNEYPTTGGHGAAGAPAIGDFWVVDGLTTGGYTYLTGSMAGVTVYNGDSVAYNGAGSWYRLGNTITVAGYVKTDGSVAMAADFNLGTYRITNAGGVIARAGSLVPLQGFLVDTTNVVISPIRSTGPDLPGMPAGQLGVDFGRYQLLVGVGSSNVPLLAVPYFSTTTAYVAGDYVRASGNLWRSRGAVAAGAFTPSQWYAVMDSQGGQFYGPVNIDVGNGAALRLSAAGNTNYLDLGAGRAGPTDPDGWMAARSGSLWLYAVNQTAQLDKTSGEFSCAQFRSSGGVFVGHPSSVVIAPGTGGTIYLRPNGPGGSSAQWTISASDGHLTGAYLVRAAGFEGVTNNTVIGNAPGGSSGAVYIRPRGLGVAGGQVVVDFGGSMQASADVYAGSGNFFSTTTSLVLGVLTAGGLIYVRPDGNTTAKQSYFNSAGDLVLTGNIIAANHPVSDIGQKKDVTTTAPRDLSGLPFYHYTYIANDQQGCGPMANEVEEVAPEYVFVSYNEAGDPVRTLNYGGLAIEMCMNALRRVRDVELRIAALDNPPPDPTTEPTPTPHKRIKR